MKKFFSILAAVLFAGSMMAETVTLTMEDFADVSFTDQTSGISVSTAKNAGQTAPAYNATGKDLRVYAKGSITIEATKNITSISFTISDKGKNRLAPLTANVGSVVVAGDPDFTAEWTGSATSVTLTVGDVASYGTESTKAGQLCFTAIVVTLGEGESGGSEGEGGSNEGEGGSSEGEGDGSEGEGDGNEGEFSYDYEPEEVSTFDVQMTAAEVEDLTAEYGVVAMYFENADSLYFASLELIISSTDLLQPDTYQINDSEEEGTFFASPGGDDEYDYGCFFGVGFIDPEDGEEYYNPYYLVSGNVTLTETGIQVQAKSYNGSTVNFTYVAPSDAVENTKLTDKLLKAIENGNVIIKSGNVIFNVNGQRIK